MPSAALSPSVERQFDPVDRTVGTAAAAAGPFAYASAAPGAPQDALFINFLWLLRLRWWAIIGQAAIISAVEWIMGITLPLRALFCIVALEVVTNTALALWSRRRPLIHEWMLAAIMAVDVMLLTILLSMTGGTFNPFSFLYLVHIALAAVVLRSILTWALVALSLGGFGLLFVMPAASGPHTASAAHADHMRMHLEGMWVAFGVAAGFIVYFVQRVTRALAQREAELVAVRALTARNEAFASLATLAAGAAHELSTPLSTIAVVAKELERQLALGIQPDATADVRLIRDQVTRCRDILQQMAADAGQATGESSAPVTVDDLLRYTMDGALAADRIEVDVSDAVRGQRLHVPARAVAQAVRGVLKNAVQASRPEQPVQLHVAVEAGTWRFAVRDRGAGMSPEVLQHAGEPFFTTKAPGQGMGLGLFLTRAVLTRLGGRLDLASIPGAGTTAVLVLPAATHTNTQHSSIASRTAGRA